MECLLRRKSIDAPNFGLWPINDRFASRNPPFSVRKRERPASGKFDPF